MKLLLASILLFVSSVGFSGIKKEGSFDLGIGLAPSFTPETGYYKSKFRLGIEAGYSFFKYSDVSLVKIKGVGESQSPAAFKLLRVGASYIDGQAALLVSPISVMIRDRAYLSPTFGFGKNPYTIFSLSYSLVEGI